MNNDHNESRRIGRVDGQPLFEVDVTILDLLKIIRKHIKLILGTFILFIVIIAGITAMISPKYKAQSTLQLGRGNSDIMTSFWYVLQEIRLRVGSSEVNSSMDINQNASVVNISYLSASKEMALQSVKQVTDEIVERYNMVINPIMLARQKKISLLNDQIQLNAKLLQSSVDIIENRKDKDKDYSVSVGYSLQGIKNLYEYQNKLQNDLSTLIDSYDIDLLQSLLLVPPYVGNEPDRPDWSRNLKLGGIFGILFGLLIAVFKGLSDNSKNKIHDENNSF